ncbi:hypothetical protein J6590_088618, partial [Homalodisca vitripennis]
MEPINLILRSVTSPQIKKQGEIPHSWHPHFTQAVYWANQRLESPNSSFADVFENILKGSYVALRDHNLLPHWMCVY